MKRQLKNKAQLFDYLMYGYIYELEEVETKRGLQKRLKDSELAQELKERTKENVKAKDLLVELKLGPSYNRSTNVWIQLCTLENKSGAKGRYVGISFSKQTNEIELWLGFGRTSKKKSEIFELAKDYKIKYSLIEPDLKYGFEYKADCSEAIFIEKKIRMESFDEEEFDRDLEYITDLYKAYEIRFEHAILSIKENANKKLGQGTKVTYEELNEKMLCLIEEVGNLAKAIKELKDE